MSINDLHLDLIANGIRDDAYCLTGGLPSERYTIEQTDEVWLVYYSERGIKSGLQQFTNESDACEELLSRILNDLTTHAGDCV